EELDKLITIINKLMIDLRNNTGSNEYKNYNVSTFNNKQTISNKHNFNKLEKILELILDNIKNDTVVKNNNKATKIIKKYKCIPCNYSTFHKNDMNKHYNSQKHLNNAD